MANVKSLQEHGTEDECCGALKDSSRCVLDFAGLCGVLGVQLAALKAAGWCDVFRWMSCVMLLRPAGMHRLFESLSCVCRPLSSGGGKGSCGWFRGCISMPHHIAVATLLV